MRLDVRRVVILNHLNARPAIHRNLVNVRPFQQPKADVGVAQTVSSAPPPVAIELQILLIEDRVEQLAMSDREQEIARPRIISFFQSVEGTHGTGHALAVTYPVL